MNHSIYSADRTTHIKIVIVALVAGIGTVGLGLAARIQASDQSAQTAYIVKAKAPSPNQQLVLALPVR